MSAYEVIENLRTPALYALWQAWFAIAATGRVIRSICASIWSGLQAAAEDLAALHFRMRRTQYAFRDRAAGLRQRMPATPKLPGSTFIAYLSVVFMSAILIGDLVKPSASSASTAPERRPEWIEIARPHGAFALESSALAGLESHYLVRRHRMGGGRKDELTFGSPESPGPYVRLSFYRPGAEGMAEPDALEAAAALAAQSDINADLQETSGKVRTKFGDLPAVNMRIHVKDGWRNCLAVAGAWSDPRLGLVAWWCNSGPEIVALGEFACFLDRATLMSAGGDDQLAEFFARAELKRNYCNAQGSFVSPTPHRPDDWIHDKRSPQLRGKLTAR